MSFTLVMDYTGQIKNTPRRGKLASTDNLAVVTSAGYLNFSNIAPNTLYSSDIIDAYIGIDAASGIGSYYQLSPTFSNGVITLIQLGANSEGTTNKIAIFTNDSGAIGNADGEEVTHIGTIVAGDSADAGFFRSRPGLQNSSFDFRSETQAGAFVSSLRNASFAQATNVIIADPGAATGYIVTTPQSPDPGINLISFDVTVGQAALAAGGNVPLIVSSGSKRYKLRTLQLNSGGTNFSGGGGDRNISITDGTTVYSVIPAATAQALANTAWGATGLPFPAAAAINTSTAAGANLRAIYSGGTADYTAGSLVISAIYQRVA